MANMGSCIEHRRAVVANDNIVVVSYIVGKKTNNVFAPIWLPSTKV
jgi:hypothetical protein